MTGSLLLGKNDSEPPKYTRAIIHLDDGQNIFFRDPRKFGVLKLLKDTKEIDAKLGPEPLEKEFTLKYLREGLSKRTAPIKALLFWTRNLWRVWVICMPMKRFFWHESTRGGLPIP